jgi:hypothetical protein
LNERERHAHEGEPGKPGQPGTEQHGGEGGAGGTGGEGGTEGGVGGAGGTGGELRIGPRGPRGPANRFTLAGYAILVAGVLVGFWLDQRQDDELEKQAHQIAIIVAQNKVTATETRDALCQFTEELEERAAATRQRIDDLVQFLQNNPQGAPGIPRAVVLENIRRERVTIEGQIDTVRALDRLRCPDH